MITVSPPPITAFPINRTPFSNMVPFTYWDHATNAEILTRLRHWLYTDFTNWVNENFDNAAEQWNAELATLIARVNDALENQSEQVNDAIADLNAYVNAELIAQDLQLNTELQEMTDYVDAAVASIINATIAVTDPVMAGVLDNPASATNDRLNKRFKRHIYIEDFGAVGDGVTPCDAAFAAGQIAAKAAGTRLKLGSGIFKLTAPINLVTGFFSDGDSVIDVGALTAPFVADNVQDIIITDMQFTGTSRATVALTARNAARSIHMYRNKCVNIRLLSTNPGVTYANADTAMCYDVYADNNVLLGGTGGTDLAAILLVYVTNGSANGNKISNYRHGVQFWGGNSNFNQQGAVTNPRKCKNIVINDNNVDNIGLGGLWGSMGENVTISTNEVSRCGDVGVDFEGCFNGAATGNTISECTNAGIAMFFYNRGIAITGNVVSTSLANAYTIAVFNSGSYNSNKGIGIVGNTVTGVGVIARLGHDTADDILVAHNVMRNVKISWDATNYRHLSIVHNQLHFDVIADAAFTAIELFRPRTGAYLPRQVAEHNTITSSVVQPAGSIGIHMLSDSSNENTIQEANFNRITGFEIDIQCSGISPNAGITPMFIVRENIFNGIGIKRVEGSTLRSRVTPIGNRMSNTWPWPGAIPTDITQKWDRGVRIEFAYDQANAGGYTGAICVVAGSPGTWKRTGLIEA